MCIYIILIVFYLFTELVGYSVDLKINYGVYKLVRTPRVIKKIVTTQLKKVCL